MTIQELETIMQEHGIVLRAIPNKTCGVYEVSHKDEFPEGRIVYLEEYKREMLVVERTPKNAGKFLIELVHSTAANVCFTAQFYDNIEGAVNAMLSVDTKSSNYEQTALNKTTQVSKLKQR